jgi:hypothetical protein
VATIAKVVFTSEDRVRDVIRTWVRRSQDRVRDVIRPWLRLAVLEVRPRAGKRGLRHLARNWAAPSA